MIIRPPGEPRWVSWLVAAAWTLVIYLTIPLARTVQSLVAESIGRSWFTYGVLVVLAGSAGAAAWTLRGRPLRMTWAHGAWLAAVGAAYAGWTLRLGLGSPEEAVHFVEYGVLGVLLFRAFVHTIPDAGVYVAAWLLGTLLGGVDELIQWAVPKRYFDFRDIALNSASCGLALVALSRGLVPVYVRPGLSRASIRPIVALGVAVLLMFLLLLRNTPSARAHYEQRIPGVARLLTHARAMVQYGYLYEDPEIGRYKSRLSPLELQETDRARGMDVATILDEYHSPDRYAEFLDTFSFVDDPFLCEARVHLFRRDRYRHTAAEHRTTDPDEYRRHITIAYRENLIMESRFPNTLARSIFQLKPETVEAMRAAHDPSLERLSGVSIAVITVFSERQATGIILAALLAWTAGWAYLYRRKTDVECHPSQRSSADETHHGRD